MTKYAILHNPRCSKSRITLQLLQDNNMDPTIIEYLKTPPTAIELTQILKKLNMPVRECIRAKEKPYLENNLDNSELSDKELIDCMCKHPILIERPIVYSKNAAIIGRPPENVLTLL
jgi:arsenate reductase (glutaredoxin)